MSRTMWLNERVHTVRWALSLTAQSSTRIGASWIVRNLVMYAVESDRREEWSSQARSFGSKEPVQTSRGVPHDDFTPGLLSFSGYRHLPSSSPPQYTSPLSRYARQASPRPLYTPPPKYPSPSSVRPTQSRSGLEPGMLDLEKSPKRRGFGDRAPVLSSDGSKEPFKKGVPAAGAGASLAIEGEGSATTRRARRPPASSPKIDAAFSRFSAAPSTPSSSRGRTRARSPSIIPPLLQHPPPRPRRSPGRSTSSTPPRQSLSSSSSSTTFSSTLESASSTPSKPSARRLSKVTSPDSQAIFRLDRPQVIPESYISRRLSIDFVSGDGTELPGSWTVPPEKLSLSHIPQVEEGPEDNERIDPEDWARQRRMSSLISGLGIVFGSAITSETMEESPDLSSDEVIEVGSSPMTLEEFVYEGRYADDLDSAIPTPPSTPGSGSEFFESADEGDDDLSSNSGRRRFPKSRSKELRRSSNSFPSSTLGTIVDNSPVIDAYLARQNTLSRSPTSQAEMVSVAFGYAYDSPEVIPSPLSKEIEEPPSVKQLLRQSWKLSQVSSLDFTPADDKRLSNRATERLALDDSPTEFTAQMADLVGSRKPLLSSYTPSPRPVFSRSSSRATPSPVPSSAAVSTSTAPTSPPLPSHDPKLASPSPSASSYFPPQRSHPVSPEISRSPKLSSSSNTGEAAIEAIRRERRESNDGHQAVEALRQERRNSANNGLTAIEAIRRERKESFSMRRRSLSVVGDVGSSPGSSKADDSRRSSVVKLAVESFTRPRTLSDSGVPSSGPSSKSAKRISALFNNMGMGRNRDSKDSSDLSKDPTPPPSQRRPSGSRPIISGPVPVLKPSSPVLPDQAAPAVPAPAISPSPFSSRTWRSTMSPSEYETLTSRYGALEMRRQEVIWELCETEKSFVAGLCGVIRVFTLPLRTPTGTWIKGVPIAVSRLLDWLQDIVFLHSQISDGLEAAREPDFPVVARIADAFLPFVSRLEVHQPYLVRFESVTKAIDEMAADAANDFGEFVRMQSSLPECASLSLSSFLLKPVQRLMKYPLFFKQLCDLTPATHPDHISTLSLLHSTDSMIRVMQEVKTREDEYEEAKLLESRIRGLPEGFRLARRDRRLVAHGLLRRVHINDKDRTVLEMDAMARALSGDPNRAGTSHLAPDPALLAPTDSRRVSVVSDSSSSVSAASTSMSDVSASSWASPPTPLSSTFDCSTNGQSGASSGSRPTSLVEPTPVVERRSSATSIGRNLPVSSAQSRLVKTKAKESSVYAFVFSDLVVLATKSNDAVRFMRSPRNSTRRLEQGPMYKVVEGIGLSRVLGVSDLSGKTEHDHLVEVDLLPMPAGDEHMSNLSIGNATLATSVYLTIPHRPSSSRHTSSQDTQLKERMRWLQAFERSYLFALRSLSFPSLLNAHTLPITQNERLSCASFVEAGVMPKSPSLQYLERMEVTTVEDDDGAQQEREERAWWAVRLKKVRKEVEGSMGMGRSVLSGRAGGSGAWVQPR